MDNWSLKGHRVRNWHIAILFILLGLMGNFSCDREGSTRFTPQQTKAIEDILRNDRRLVSNLEDSIRGDMTDDDRCDLYARNIARYAAEAKRFDNSKVPTEFAIAYKEYLDAWESKGGFIAHHPRFGTLESNMAEGFIRGMLGDPTGWAIEKQNAINQWYAWVKSAETSVINARQKVENTAMKYGAKLQ